jgi:tRNA dimethylallyltransferase
MALKQLIVIVGPTAVGKTGLAVQVASRLKTEIINADSRQIYREMNIGTAVPSKAEMEKVKHYFIGHKSIHEYYNASMFELEAVSLLDGLFEKFDNAVLTGGSGLYIDAVCYGIDDLPSVDMKIREQIKNEYRNIGLEGMRKRLQDADPVSFQRVDLNNPKRMIKALEIYEMTGKPYSAFLTGRKKPRSFSILKIGLNLPRHILHERINRRVDDMLVNGLLGEIRNLYPFRNLNALNTVGYKELFDYLDDKCTLEEAAGNIKAHTRQYARRQLTWFGKDKETEWFRPDQTELIFDYIDGKLQHDGIS